MANMSSDNLKNNLNNPARLYLWEVLFTNPIGGGDAESLELRCQTATLPGRSVGEILIPFKATAGIKVPGKLVMSHNWTATFVEGIDKAVFTALQAWSQTITNARTGVGGLDTLIKSNIYLRLQDVEGNVFLKIKLVGCYLQAVDDVPLAFEAEGVIMFNATFSYDFWEDIT